LPNYRVFTEQASDFKSLVYGNDGTTDRVLLTDSSGALAIYADTALDVEITSSTTLTVTATDLDIRDITNATDSILVYGNDGSSNQVILTNASGAVGVYSHSALDVTATDLDIRDITNATDSILVYGNDGTSNRVLLTDTSGNMQTVLYRRQATDTSEEGLSTATDFAGSTARDIGEQSQVTFAVKNTGTTYGATVKIQLSPNNSDWIDDTAETNISAGEMVALVPGKYLRYARVAYKSQTAGQDTSLTIWYQAQV